MKVVAGAAAPQASAAHLSIRCIAVVLGVSRIGSSAPSTRMPVSSAKTRGCQATERKKSMRPCVVSAAISTIWAEESWRTSKGSASIVVTAVSPAGESRLRGVTAGGLRRSPGPRSS